MFIAAQFSIVRFWNKWRCPSIDEWIKKLLYVHNKILLRHKDKFMAFSGKGMKLENIMLNEIGQAPKTKGWMYSLISGWWYIMRGDDKEREKNEVTLNGVEKNGAEVGGGREDSRIRQTVLPYVYISLHEWSKSTLCTTIEMKSCTPFMYNESKFS